MKIFDILFGLTAFAVGTVIVFGLAYIAIGER